MNKVKLTFDLAAVLNEVEASELTATIHQDATEEEIQDAITEVATEWIVEKVGFQVLNLKKEMVSDESVG